MVNPTVWQIHTCSLTAAETDNYH